MEEEDKTNSLKEGAVKEKERRWKDKKRSECKLRKQGTVSIKKNRTGKRRKVHDSKRGKEEGGARHI